MGQINSVQCSNVVKKVKKLALSISIFHVLHGEYLLKQKVRVVQPPECKFKANHIFFSWKWQQNITQDSMSQKTIHNSVKMYKNSDKIKFLKVYDLLLLFPRKKLSLILGVAHAGPVFAQV